MPGCLPAITGALLREQKSPEAHPDSHLCRRPGTHGPPPAPSGARRRSFGLVLLLPSLPPALSKENRDVLSRSRFFESPTR